MHCPRSASSQLVLQMDQQSEQHGSGAQVFHRVFVLELSQEPVYCKKEKAIMSHSQMSQTQLEAKCLPTVAIITQH